MPFYNVKVIDKTGQVREFNRDYSDIAALREDVRQNGHLLVHFKEKKKRKKLLHLFLHRLRSYIDSRTISDEDIYNLFYELGIILKAGVPIMRAFRMMVDETRKEAVKHFLDDVSFQLKEGGNFSDILEKKCNFYGFAPYIPIIRRGEKTGQLGESFLNTAASIEKKMKIKSEIVDAMIYPMILVGTGLMAVYIILIYVIPRFETIVKSFKVVLPFHTRVLFSLSLFLNKHQELVIAVLIVFMAVLLVLVRNPRFKGLFTVLLGKIPLIRSIRLASENLQFLGTFSTLLNGGVPILAALNLASESYSSPKVRERLSEASLSLRKGDSLAGALKETEIFPDIIPNMVRVGEESGTLPEVLVELYHFMSERFLKKTRRYMNLLEPAVIVFIAIFIGFLIMSVIPIIMNISDINI